VGDAAGDITLLLRASLLLGEALFIWVEDAAHYFNQFGYAPEELPKSTYFISARDGDLTDSGQQFSAGDVIFVSEGRLGFGSFASSNIAQRFSNALVGWTLEELDRLETEARAANPSKEWEQWMAERKPLEAKCRLERPKKKGQAETDCVQSDPPRHHPHVHR
jgi:hypothetical protein